MFRNENSVHYWFFSFGILRPITPIKTKNNSLEEYFEEMSENLGENMCYPYFCADSSGLVNVSL